MYHTALKIFIIVIYQEKQLFCSARDLMADIELGLSNVSADHDVTEWRLMRDALRLSEGALSYNTDLLPSQILGRVAQVTQNHSTRTPMSPVNFSNWNFEDSYTLRCAPSVIMQSPVCVVRVWTRTDASAWPTTTTRCSWRQLLWRHRAASWSTV